MILVILGFSVNVSLRFFSSSWLRCTRKRIQVSFPGIVLLHSSIMILKSFITFPLWLCDNRLKYILSTYVPVSTTQYTLYIPKYRLLIRICFLERREDYLPTNQPDHHSDHSDHSDRPDRPDTIQTIISYQVFERFEVIYDSCHALPAGILVVGFIRIVIRICSSFMHCRDTCSCLNIPK